MHHWRTLQWASWLGWQIDSNWARSEEVVKTVPELVRLAARGESSVRLAALDVLGRLQPPDIVAILAPLALSEDADVARGAIRAMRHVTDPAIDGHLDALSRASDEWRRVEAITASAQRGGPNAIAALEWVAAADESAAVAESAIDGLAAIATRAPRDGAAGADATRALVALTAEPSRRDAAVTALARLPWHASPTSPAAWNTRRRRSAARSSKR